MRKNSPFCETEPNTHLTQWVLYRGKSKLSGYVRPEVLFPLEHESRTLIKVQTEVRLLHSKNESYNRDCPTVSSAGKDPFCQED